ncbi:inner centromere protein [Anopheles nili]|uniref:inner centromere protein n=1 Tax=Anopheles nili TaxID=185578 RepID=UPI00237AF9CD|nr:inner centromere protein [Anopheles nili]
MDELLEMFNSFIGEAFDREKAMEVEFKEFETKLNECVMQAKERGTPVQNKKRPKRQLSISERDENSISGTTRCDTTTNEDQGSHTTMTQSSERNSSATNRSSARMLNVSGPSQEKAPPQQTVPSSEDTTARPSRAARIKAQDKLKEIPLKSKIRNDAGSIAMSIKTERISTVANGNGNKIAEKSTLPTDTEQTFNDMEVENDANQANRIISKEQEPSKKRSPSAVTRETSSLLVVPPVIPKVEIVSDEEMPPPKMPPPKPAPKARTKKKPAAEPEKSSKEAPARSTVSSADSMMDDNVSQESNKKSEIRPTRGRPPKAKAEAKQSTTNGPNLMIEPSRVKSEKLSIVQQQTSGQSVYEDAHEQEQEPELQREPSASELQSQMRPLKIALQKMPVPQPLPHDLNGTYVVTQPASSNMTSPTVQDGTFTVTSPMDIGPGGNETFNIPAKGATPVGQNGAGVTNETFVLDKSDPSKRQGPANLANASIMTEDDSVIENSPIQAPQIPELKPKQMITSLIPPMLAPKPKNLTSMGIVKKASNAKKNKELFNPCVMSPIKSRIEAFEKCVTTGQQKVGTPHSQIGRIVKTVSTPTLVSEPVGLVRSAQAKSTVCTPNSVAQPIQKASSASKIAQMQNRAVLASASTMTRSQSRDSSWDRAGGGGASGGTLSAASSTSSLLDEKKKKREEKQRLATQQREAIEREKREHAERLLREKDEKFRKLVNEKQEKMRLDAQKKARKLEEFEKRRQQEEQKALADQKREDLAKQMAEQQRIDRELLESLKQSQTKENHEIKLHKQLYQQKLRQQQQQLEKQQLAAKKKTTARSQAFVFEMIDTDDSTDEDVPEDPNAPRKKKRPPIPDWCKHTANFRKNLAIQAQIDTKVIDRLFSVQPMTPDLRKLFPTIDARKLKRNSSAIWRTPPRYSQLP